MTDTIPSDAGADLASQTPAAKGKTRRKPGAEGRKPNAARKNKDAPAKSKKDQLIALLSKPNGARVTVIVERLNWQAHTVRAALSALRRQGLEIATSKSAKTGETVYAIKARANLPGRDGAGDQA